MATTLGNHIAELRENRGLTRAALAEALNVSEETIGFWEEGTVEPSDDELNRLAAYFEVNVEELEGHECHCEHCEHEHHEEEMARPHMRITSAQKLIAGLGSIIALVAYLIVGFTWKGPTGALGWAAGWTILLLPVVISSLVMSIEDRCLGHFQISILVVMVYCDMGIIGWAYGVNLWHPFWILFFLIPIYHATAGFIDRRTLSR